MKIRKLLRSDLPNHNKGGKSLHFPIIYNEEKRFVADIHVNNSLCYLEKDEGKPVMIDECFIIEKELELENTIKNMIYNLDQKRIKLKEKYQNKLSDIDIKINSLENLLK